MTEIIARTILFLFTVLFFTGCPTKEQTKDSPSRGKWETAD